MSTELEPSMRRSRCLYEEVFDKGNYAAADELLAEDIINHGPIPDRFTLWQQLGLLSAG